MEFTKSQKKILNIISFVAILVILVWFVVYLVQEKYSYSNKLEFANVVFYSDANILKQIQNLKDANTVVLWIERNQKPKMDFAPVILYTQIFSANGKSIILYHIDADNQCYFANINSSKNIQTTIVECKKTFENLQHPKIKMGDSDSDLTKTKIEIDGNTFNIIVNSSASAYFENHNVLEAMYPNIAETEAQISGFVSKVTQKLNK